jgi:signal transduction histidine kinase
MTRSAPTDPATPVALADRSLLETALLNLIINATDASNGLTPIIVGACKPPPDWTPPVVEAFALTATRLLPAKVRVFIDYLVANMTQADQRRT